PGGNGPDRGCDITPHESGPTSIWSLSTRAVGQPAQEARQMTGAPAAPGSVAGAAAPGAASRDAQPWHAIDWRRAHRVVRRLQARIVQAAQAGRWGKVNALQRLLTHSYSGKVLAVRRVTEHPGKHTPGVDRIIWDPGEEGHGRARAPASGLPSPPA